jgi:hypothetical protein
MKLKIFEFVVNRKNAVNKLTSIQDLVLNHMLCIFYWRNEAPVNHWKKEVAAFLDQIPKLKGNATLSYKTVFQELYGYISDILYKRIDSFIIGIMYKENYMLPEIDDPDVNNLENFLEEFYDFVARKISDDGYILFADTYKKINELLEKY